MVAGGVLLVAGEAEEEEKEEEEEEKTRPCPRWPVWFQGGKGWGVGVRRRGLMMHDDEPMRACLERGGVCFPICPSRARLLPDVLTQV